jgi:hypothetical protein
MAEMEEPAMTEDEAKTKICCGPVLLATAWINESEIRAKGNLIGSNCIGSACMAWRWEENTDLMPASQNDPLGGPKPPQDWDGYCGLAGKP